MNPLNNYQTPFNDQFQESGEQTPKASLSDSKVPKEFDKYLSDYLNTGSTELIPLNIQKELLAYFENNVHIQQETIADAARIRSGGFMPRGAMNNLLNYYQKHADTLKKSIAASESKSHGL